MGCGKKAAYDDYEEEKTKRKAELLKKVLKDPKKVANLVRRLESVDGDLGRIQLHEANLTRHQHNIIEKSLEELTNIIDEFNGFDPEND